MSIKPFIPGDGWRERGWPHPPGRRVDYARLVIQKRFNLTDRQMRTLGPKGIQQIVRIDDTVAIRLLLGISHKAALGET